MSAYYKDYESASTHLETLGLAFHEIDFQDGTGLCMVVHDDPARHKARSLTKYILASGRSPREAFNSAMKTLEPRQPVVARNDAAELKAAVEAFLAKHFHGGSKANRPDYCTAVPTADIYELRAALRRLAGEDNT